MKKTALLAFLALFLVGCDTINGIIWYVNLKPEQPYEQSQIPQAPDYTKTSSWALIPSSEHSRSIRPKTPQIHHDVDVFFVHPTTYHSSAQWNQPIDDQSTNSLTDSWVLPNQAGIFSECCQLYLPRYRQATLYAFMTEEESAFQARELAFSDIQRAFEYYLKTHNKGRPFIIAAHSQGAWHALKLLERKIVNSKLKDQLVSAYLVGMPLPEDKLSRSLSGTPVCAVPSQTQCIISWNAISDSAYKDLFFKYSHIPYDGHYETNEGKSLVCVNPLSWKDNDQYAGREFNLGGIDFARNPEEDKVVDFKLVSAECKNGLLEISEPLVKGKYDWMLFGEGIYHMHDYDLFHMNIKENARLRIESYLQHTQKSRYSRHRVPEGRVFPGSERYGG